MLTKIKKGEYVMSEITILVLALAIYKIIDKLK